MVMGKLISLVALLLLLIIHFHPSLSFSKCKKHELDALFKFKHSFTQDPLRLLSTWVGDDCCHWPGVGCDNLSGNVIKLNLANLLNNTIAGFSGLVSSEISSALLELNFLTHLDLSWNDFNESRIPTFVGSMTKLTYLNLGYARLSGRIPPQIGNLTNLVYLDLDGVSGMLYTEESLEWASGLSKLQYLDMNYINMSQTYDTLQVLLKLPSLLELYLGYCSIYNIHSSEPWISNTTSTLQQLLLTWNHFDGHVPLWLTNMKCLQYLDISSKELNGILPSRLGQLTNLSHLDLSSNQFQGSVPESLAQLSALKYLDLSNNRMMSGWMPNILGRLTEIEILDISYNSLHGTISGMGNLSKLSFLGMNLNNIKLNFSTDWQPPFQLQILEVSSCEMNIPFPQWLRNQTQMEILDLSYTGISGELPQWLGNFTNLLYIKLAGNKLTGYLPHHFTCDGCNLEWLELQRNMLSGLVPHWLKHLKKTSVVDLSQNMLTGKFFEGQNASSLLSGGTVLFFLDLSDNMFSGEIHVTHADPHAYNNGPTLQFLSLRGNDFSGYISSQLCQFTNLSILDLAHNHLTGKIPRCSGSLVFQSGINYATTVGMEIQEIIKGTPENFVGTAGIHSIIDLSCNGLVGTIPKELTNITKLMQLNLSNNHLTGGIPDDIGNLGFLESLDLSNNNLSGGIPQSLSDIRWLSFLNLSNNNLEGPIPSGSQLQTLDDPSIYDGNSGLCGFPLPKCSESSPSLSPTYPDHGSEEENDAKDKLDRLWLYLAIMSGVATGFWGVIGTLAFKKSWRHAYFRFVEKTGDRIYVPFKVRMNRFWRTDRNREF